MAYPAGRPNPNAGRPKGSRHKRTVELVEATLAQGVTPVEVMLGTMRRLWEIATTSDEGVISALNAQGRSQHGAALEACDIAAKCAPYIHPKLVAQQVSFTGETAADYFRELASRLPV